ncbi:uncharacterized protein LOC131852984 [Achroia grisella]|uniref:uncharacterized protein LOC131852984 n=1 Tax=Achroia grisella TaxID=688607 RepID=UPI0027D22AAE|nr:uncharacterized protein LOC131852984 [Achroia grisella]
MTSILMSEGSDSAAAVGAGEGTTSPWFFSPPERGRSPRRRRSRSSPVRLSLASLATRTRSPLASPHRHSTATTRLSSVQPDVYCADQKLDWPSGSAYFSVMPPATPLRLVPLVTSPMLSPRAESPHQKPELVVPMVILSETKELSIEDPPMAKKRMPSGCQRRIVRRLLQELVTGLPLPVTTLPCTVTYRKTNVSSTLVSAAKVSQAVITASATLLSTSRIAAECKHVAIQAPTHIKRSEKHEENSSFASGVEKLPAKDEWVGGVRALRDSHVRLVLRQLRHIERLNRALDRAAPTISVHNLKH